MNFTLKLQLMKKIVSGLLLFFLFGIVLSCDKEETIKEIIEETIIEETLPTVYEGWTLQWNDEFNEEQINTNNWNYELGDGTDYGLPIGWGNNEKQIYTANNENFARGFYSQAKQIFS